MSDSTLTYSSLSLEYVKCLVSKDDGTSPTGDTVYMALVSDGVTPQSSDFKAGSWQTIQGLYYARCLIGPGSGTIQLTAGYYVVWVKITDSPEVPVRRVGFIQMI